jgi:ATP-binding cassette, subfamily F, member 3
VQKLKNQAKQAEAMEAKKKHMQAFVDKFRYNAKRASLVQSRIKAIERLGDVQLADRDPEYVFNFPFPEISLTQDAVSFQDVSFNYKGRPTLFKNVSFGLALETRAAIVGPNGKPLQLYWASAMRWPGCAFARH